MARTVELEDAYVAVAVVGAVVGTHRGGIACAEDHARRVCVLVSVEASRRAPVVGRRTGVGRKMQIGVDDKNARGVVVAYLEDYFVVFELINGFYFNQFFAVGLIGIRFQFDNVGHGCLDNQIAVLNAQSVDTLVSDNDIRGVCSGIDDKVVFHRVCRRVDLHIDTVVKVVIQNRLKHAHTGSPSALVAAYEVVLAAALAIQTFNAGCVTSFEINSIGVMTIATFLRVVARKMLQVVVVGMLHHKRETVALHKQRRAVHRRAEQHPAVPLPFVLRKENSSPQTYCVTRVACLQKIGSQ